VRERWGDSSPPRARRLVPALANVALDIPHWRASQHEVRIVPWMWRRAEIGGARARIKRMRGRVPSIEVTAILNCEINAADEGYAVIYRRAFLV
jgi:hypothetical protein